jgi:hypothetical protein
VRFKFEKEPPGEIDIEGHLNSRVSDNELELTLVKTSDEKISEWAERTGATEFNIIHTSLEDQFIDYTAPKKCSRLFQWEKN